MLPKHNTSHKKTARPTPPRARARAPCTHPPSSSSARPPCAAAAPARAPRPARGAAPHTARRTRTPRAARPGWARRVSAGAVRGSGRADVPQPRAGAKGVEARRVRADEAALRVEVARRVERRRRLAPDLRRARQRGQGAEWAWGLTAGSRIMDQSFHRR